MEKKKAKITMTNHVQKWAPVILWCGVIFFLSSQPRLPGPEDAVADFLFKKMGHICAYALLFVLVFRAVGAKTKSRGILSVLLCVLYALSDEIHQSFVPGRTPMLRDVGIDMIGMGVGYLVLKLKR